MIFVRTRNLQFTLITVETFYTPYTVTRSMRSAFNYYFMYPKRRQGPRTLRNNNNNNNVKIMLGVQGHLVCERRGGQLE